MRLLCGGTFNPRAYTMQSSRALRSFSTKLINFSNDLTYKDRWAKKESLGEYLKQRLPHIESYLNSLEFSANEESFLRQIKTNYQNRTTKVVEDIFPFKFNLEKENKTYENSGLNFLRKKDVRLYLENGIIGPIKIKTISQATLQAVFSRYTGIPKDLTPKDYREARVRQEWQNKDILDLACNEEIVGKISSLLGDHIKVRFTGIHEVPPRAGSFSSITEGKIAALCAHSDTNLAARLSKKGMDGPLVDLDSINVWISISETNPRNGPLYVFPKTHQWSILTPLKYLEHASHDKDVLERVLKLLSISGFGHEMIANHALYYNYLLTSKYQHLLSKIKRTEIYTKPGECLIFNSHLLHGSDINWTPKSRLAISIRYSRATNSENEDNLKAVNAMFSRSERERLGIKENDNRTPIIQVLGTKHHENSIAVNFSQLRKILRERLLKN